MPRFKATVYWAHTINDYADVEVEAKDKAEAKAKLMRLCEYGELPEGSGVFANKNEVEVKAVEDIEFEDGDIVAGEYVTRSRR